MDAVFGPSQDFQVPAMISGSGVLSQTGENLSVLVVDCPEEVANHLREFQEGEEIVYSCDEDAPFSFPSIDALLPLVRAWAVATSDQLAAFYTRLHTRGRGRPRINDTRTCNASCPKKASHKGYSYRRWTKPKRVTTASLSTQLQQVMEALPQLTLQMQALADKQMIFEDQLPTLGKSAAVAVAQPLGQALDLPRHPMSGLAKAVPPPFRTVSFPTVPMELHVLRRWRLWRPRGWTNLQDLARSQEMHWPRLCWPSPRL